MARAADNSVLVVWAQHDGSAKTGSAVRGQWLRTDSQGDADPDSSLEISQDSASVKDLTLACNATDSCLVLWLGSEIHGRTVGHDMAPEASRVLPRLRDPAWAISLPRVAGSGNHGYYASWIEEDSAQRVAVMARISDHLDIEAPWLFAAEDQTGTVGPLALGDTPGGALAAWIAGPTVRILGLPKGWIVQDPPRPRTPTSVPTHSMAP
jgi:hypothetical protein